MEKMSEATGRDEGEIGSQEKTEQVMEVEMKTPEGMKVQAMESDQLVVDVETKAEEVSPAATVLQESNRTPEPPPATVFPAPKPKVQVPPRVSMFSRERYMSPTDSLVSPISKGLQARSRKPRFFPTVPPKPFQNLLNENDEPK